MDLLDEFEPGARVVEAGTPADLDVTLGARGGAIAVLYGDPDLFGAAAEVSVLEREGASILMVADAGARAAVAERGWVHLARPFTDAEFRTSIDIAKSVGATGRRASEPG